MTITEIAAGLDEQIANAEATLRDVSWAAERLRVTLVELKVLKSTLTLLANVQRPQEVATT